ncbi:MAG: peptidoglycan DD-metalloendopeptidase family protein [Bacteroidia bacterium]
MSKVKYRYNTKSLTYEKVQIAFKDRFKKLLSYLATGTVFAGVTVFIAFTYFNSPKELAQKREITELKLQYDLLNKRMDLASQVLNNLQDRDDNIYRVILEAPPIPNDVRKAGFGGVDRYQDLQGYDNSDLLVETTKKLDIITKQLYIQSKSFDEVAKLAENKKEMLANIPAIQPIATKDLIEIGSGFGWRMHPIFKTMHFHTGVDLVAHEGTPIYASGDGVVEPLASTEDGYGNHVVIDHGYGYESLYGHMSKIIVQPGQKVKRGEVIGYVGSTGLSTGPHLHYEVIKNGERVNPVNFFYHDLTPAEFQQITRAASQPGQSFD